MTGVDKATGRPMYVIEKAAFTHAEDRQRYTQAGNLTEEQVAALDDPEDYTGTEIEWCPGIAARNWQNDAFSPATGLLYTSTSTSCGTQVVIEGEYEPGEGYTLRRRAGTATRLGFGGVEITHRGELQANDPVAGRTVWSVKYEQSSNSPVLATAGNLVFKGEAAIGAFAAYNATTGDELYRFTTGGGFSDSAISYIGPDGKQYIAVISSNGRRNAVAVDDAPDERNRYSRLGATLYVFALAG
jgi:outer membrane protein assembly factor BamB